MLSVWGEGDRGGDEELLLSVSLSFVLSLVNALKCLEFGFGAAYCVFRVLMVVVFLAQALFWST